MNIAIFSTTGAYSGIGFAVPANIIKNIVSSLIVTDSFRHPWLGAFGNDITPDIAEARGLSLSQGRGFLVMDEDEGKSTGNVNAAPRGGDKSVVNIN